MTSQKVRAKFELAKTLKEAGIPVKKIASIVERKTVTVKTWLKYDTYDEYSAVNLERLARQKQKASPSPEPSEAIAAWEAQDSDFNMVVPRTYFESIDQKLDEVLSLLKVIR